MRIRFVLSQAGLDLASLTLAWVAASQLLYGTPSPWQGTRAFGSITPQLAAMTLGLLIGSYVSIRAFANGVPRPTYGRALWIAVAIVGTTALFVLLVRPFYSNEFLATSTTIWTGLALAVRAARRRRPWTERMVVVTGEKGLVEDLQGSDHADVLEVMDPLSSGPYGPLPENTSLVVDLRALLSEETARFVSSCSLAGYPIRSFSSVYEEHTGRMPIVHLAEGWELTVPVGSRDLYDSVKRVFDVSVVLLASVLWVPLAAVVALAIRLDSEGQVIFTQERLGLHGRPFLMYKFRSMKLHSQSEESVYPLPDDPRLTRVGRILRRYRLDELPQLWNVLRGTVSLVGPRPEWKLLADRYAETIPFYYQRHLVRPGITGWAQVNFGYADSEADVIEKLSYDLYYVKHMSIWLDLQVLGKSLWTVVSGYGAQ